MTSLVPKMDECDVGENVRAYSEDERKIKNVGEPQVIEHESLVNKDNAFSRPLPSVNEDAQVYTTSWQWEEKAYLPPRYMKLKSSQISTDSAARNYGRAPLIEEFFNGGARPLPSVNEEAFGGGIRTLYDQIDFGAVVEVSASQVQVSLPVPARQPERNSTNRVSPTVIVHQSQHQSTHQANQTITVHPPHQKSTKQVNPTAKIIKKNGGCFQWFRHGMLYCLVKK